MEDLPTNYNDLCNRKIWRKIALKLHTDKIQDSTLKTEAEKSFATVSMGKEVNQFLGICKEEPSDNYPKAPSFDASWDILTILKH